MASALERVLGTPELLDHILKDVNFSDIFIFQRINKRFRQHISKAHRLQQRLQSRLPDPKTEKDEFGDVHVDSNSLFASRFLLSFLYLEPFEFMSCSVVTRPWEQHPILELTYNYTPRNAPACMISPSIRAYHDNGTVAMRRGYKFYEASPSWANIWLPNAGVRICLQVYRDLHHYTYTEATQLGKDKAEMRSVAMALHELAERNEARWSARKTLKERSA